MKSKATFVLSLLLVALFHYVALSQNIIPKTVKILDSKKKLSSVIKIRMAAIAKPEPIQQPFIADESIKNELLEPKQNVLTKKTVPEVEEVVRPVIKKSIMPNPLRIKKQQVKKVLIKQERVKKNKKIKNKKSQKRIKRKHRHSKIQKQKRGRATKQKNRISNRVSKNRYLSRIRRTIERRKRYPRSAERLGQQGVVRVRFTISSNGAIHGISIAGASPHAKLNRAALNTVKSIGSFPPIPKDLGKRSITLTVPLRYRLRQ